MAWDRVHRDELGTPPSEPASREVLQVSALPTTARSPEPGQNDAI
jgi:hypothetical protein